MACCDTCPLEPTCDDMADFLDQIGLPGRAEQVRTNGGDGL